MRLFVVYRVTNNPNIYEIHIYENVVKHMLIYYSLETRYHLNFWYLLWQQRKCNEKFLKNLFRFIPSDFNTHNTYNWILTENLSNRKSNHWINQINYLLNW